MASPAAVGFPESLAKAVRSQHAHQR